MEIPEVFWNIPDFGFPDSGLQFVFEIKLKKREEKIKEIYYT